MTPEQRLERLAERIQTFNTTLAKYPDITRGLWQVSEHSAKKDSDLRSPKELREKFNADSQKSRLLRVGIIGRVKAGKSSLLNALLFDGNDVLPKAATPMTAALTVLGYANTPCAEVEFFKSEDEEEMRKVAQDYDQEFERLVEAEIEKARNLSLRPVRPVARRGISAPPPATRAEPDIERIKTNVRNKLNEDIKLGGFKSLYESIQRAGKLPATAQERIEGQSIEDLKSKLGAYVGVGGQFTPFTKCVSLFLPLESLRDIEVVDTPGVNDPISSREKRTLDELHKCHAVFVVSPAGQFLSGDDKELMERLVQQDGVEEVFLVASRVDSQMFGSESQRHDGRFTDVLRSVQETLKQHARPNLPAPQDGSKGLDTLKRELDQRMVVSSSVAYALATRPETGWDENTRHVHGMLKEDYPDTFVNANAETKRRSLTEMAGIEEIQKLLARVREDKERIIASNVLAFFDAQEKVLVDAVKKAFEGVEERRRQVENADGNQLEQQLRAIEQASEKGKRVANVAVVDEAQRVADALRKHMEKIVDSRIADLESKAERAQGTTIETYTVDSPGVLAWVKRRFGGGTEERSETVNTLNATSIRNALQKERNELSRELANTVSQVRGGLRVSLEASILRELREQKIVADRDIDITLLKQACQGAILKVHDFDDPELPPLPDALQQSGKLKGSAADRYGSEALQYFKVLQKSARTAARTLTKDFEDRLRQADVGTALFEQYRERTREIQQQIREKDKTLQQYDHLLKEIKGLQNHV